MTAHKHLKQLIRARMEKTGERYAAARRSIVGSAAPDSSDPAIRWHFAGNVAATTALRVLLTHAGVRNPQTGQPFSEAMLFGIAGGVGIGVFSFYYERGDTATFYIAGRHCWHDHKEYLQNACEAFGITPNVRETNGAKTAVEHLQTALREDGPCSAWVDMYHVITIYDLDLEQGMARIGDLTDEPASMALADLTAARMRTKKDRCRLLSIPPQSHLSPSLEALVQQGLQRCSDGLLHPTIPQAKGNARLEALETWADRMSGSNGKESWEKIFRPGPNLWRGLSSISNYIEHYGTGGGLCRPLFAEFLEEAGVTLRRPVLRELGEQYAELGRKWSDLADAALPDNIPELREAKLLQARRAESKYAREDSEDSRMVCQKLLDTEKKEFPMSDAECKNLRAELRTRILELYQGEVAAHAALQKVIASN